MKKIIAIFVLAFGLITLNCSTDQVSDQCSVDKKGLENFVSNISLTVKNRDVSWFGNNAKVTSIRSALRSPNRDISRQIYKTAVMLQRKHGFTRLLQSALKDKRKCIIKFGVPFVELYRDKLLLVGAMKEKNGWSLFYQERFEGM